MNASSLFNLLLGVNWTLFLWEQYLNWRQYKVHLENEKRPKKVADIVKEEEYKKARDYKLDKHVFGFAHELFSQLLTTVVLVTGFMPLLWDFCGFFPLQGAIFVTVNGLIQSVIDLPWDAYDTFVIEEKHGFNKQSIGFYIFDQFKKQALSIAIMTPIIVAIEWIVDNGGPYFFVYVWIFVSIVLLLLMTIYPAFIAPLFDKYIPLPDGALKTAIEKLAASVHFPLTKLYVVHGSKRSAHSNAYMYGFWNNKRIVLYDTLLSGEEKEKVKKACLEAGAKEEEETEQDKARGMSNDEVVAVLGHELGHWALSHTVWNLIIAELNILFMFSVFAYFYKWELLYKAFGFSKPSTVVGLLLVFSYVMALYNQITNFLMSMHSRRCEFAADAYANELGHGKLLCSALTKLIKDNLSMPIDDPLYSLCNHSHPPVIERIEAIHNASIKKD